MCGVGATRKFPRFKVPRSSFYAASRALYAPRNVMQTYAAPERK